MIHMNKPAPRKVPDEIKEAVNNRDKGLCVFCGNPAWGPPHHWGLHNNQINRQNWPLLVHSVANQVMTCFKCHSSRGSGDNRYITDDLCDGLEMLLVGGFSVEVMITNNELWFSRDGVRADVEDDKL